MSKRLAHSAPTLLAACYGRHGAPAAFQIDACADARPLRGRAGPEGAPRRLPAAEPLMPEPARPTSRTFRSFQMLLNV